MREHEIIVNGGSSTRLLTAGKYCDRDIVVTATGGGGLSWDDILDANAVSGDILIEASKTWSTNPIRNLFEYRPNITSVRMPNMTNITQCPSFRSCTSLTDVYIPSVTSTTAQIFNGTGFSGTMDLSKMFPKLITLGYTTFNNVHGVTRIILPATVTTIQSKAINTTMKSLTELVFLGTPTSIDASMIAAKATPALTDVYVPWAEGEVANAPWGATNATIHYNYVWEG